MLIGSLVMTYLQVQFNMEKTKQKLPKWFNGELYAEGSVVKNPYSGEEFELTAEELSMYDFIKGAEMCIGMGILGTSKIQEDFEKGLSWFRINNGKAYMALLD